MEMKNSAEGYDYVAREIFFPLFPVIAKRAAELSGKTSGNCLDVGCGGGMFGYHIAKITDMKITFLDINEDAIKICRQRGIDWGFSDRAETIVSGVNKIDLPDNTYDLIISRGSISFWGGKDEITEAFSELYRVLKPGGFIMLGHSLGTPEIEAEIREKMKIHNPDWPNNVHRNSNGFTNDDYVRFAGEIGLDAQPLTEPSGSWVIIKKEAE